MLTLLRHQYSTVAYIVTHLVHLAFWPTSGITKKCRDLVGFELQNRTVARKFSIEGLYVCLGGIGILKFDKSSTDL